MFKVKMSKSEMTQNKVLDVEISYIAMSDDEKLEDYINWRYFVREKYLKPSQKVFSSKCIMSETTMSKTNMSKTTMSKTTIFDTNNARQTKSPKQAKCLRQSNVQDMPHCICK